MENLKRYIEGAVLVNGEPQATMGEALDGEYVKFSDVEVALRSASDNNRMLFVDTHAAFGVHKKNNSRYKPWSIGEYNLFAAGFKAARQHT